MLTLENKVIVTVSDAKVSKDPSSVLTTYSLGSCVAICLYDRVSRVGGMLHYQLPESELDIEKARSNPYMFCDTGVQMLLDELVLAGASITKIQVKVVGGATMKTGPKGFDIGKRNYLAARKNLWKRGLFIDGEDIGGSSPRNVYMSMEDGTVKIKSIGRVKKI